MSNVALRWTRTLDSCWNRLPAGADQVKAASMLRVLCDAASDDLLVWLAADTIAARTRIRSRNTIAKYLGHLECLGLIRDTGERRRAGSRDRGGAKTFRILVDGRDCSLQTEQSPDSEIAHSRLSNHPGENAQSETEIAQFGGGDCSLQSEHEAPREAPTEAAARAGAREDAAAAGAPMAAEEYSPTQDLVGALLEDRADLVDHVPDLLDRFRRHSWRRRRTRAEWDAELRTWFAREGPPQASQHPGSARGPTWVVERVRVLLSLPPAALGAQLAEDRTMAQLFGEAGGAPGVARLKPEQLVARYQAAERASRPPVPARRPLELVNPQGGSVG